MKTSQCDDCGVVGYHVDTTAGEITEAGEVVMVAPTDRPWLMVDASEGVGVLLCDECAAARGMN